jgi:hypothetical protein
MKILRESPLEPVPPEGATSGDQRSLAVELYRFINFDQPDDMDVGEEEEELGNEGGQEGEEGLNNDRRPRNMDSGEDAAEDEDEERDDDPGVEDEPEEKGRALKKMLFQFVSVPATDTELTHRRAIRQESLSRFRTSKSRRKKSRTPYS